MQIEREWDGYDVFVITAPTAAGKTEIAYTIAAWVKGEANYIQPDRILVDQTSQRYSELVPLRRRTFYPCLNIEHADPDRPCQCQFRKALKRAKEAKVRLLNYWMYFLNRDAIVAKTLIVDEGHRLVDTLRSFNDWKLRQAEFDFPSDLRTVGDFVEWAQKRLDTVYSDPLQDALDRLVSIRRDHGLVYKTFGKDLTLCVEPMTSTEFGYLFWPSKSVNKIVLMSATIGSQDIKELGLNHRNVAYLDCPSPIPTANRPLRYEPNYNLSHKCIPYALPVLAEKIDVLLQRHSEKGIIHIPYSLAGQLQMICNHPRLLYHTKKTKAAVLQEFKDSRPEDGAVLVASGLYEGVDLPYDAARWQLIAKVPYLSLNDPTIKLKQQHDPHWYAWETIKRLLQAYGRIVRAPDDYGVTYIMDTAFGSLFKLHKTKFPQFVRDALEGIK